MILIDPITDLRSNYYKSKVTFIFTVRLLQALNLLLSLFLCFTFKAENSELRSMINHQ